MRLNILQLVMACKKLEFKDVESIDCTSTSIEVEGVPVNVVKSNA